MLPPAPSDPLSSSIKKINSITPCTPSGKKEKQKPEGKQAGQKRKGLVLRFQASDSEPQPEPIPAPALPVASASHQTSDHLYLPSISLSHSLTYSPSHDLLSTTSFSSHHFSFPSLQLPHPGYLCTHDLAISASSSFIPLLPTTILVMAGKLPLRLTNIASHSTARSFSCLARTAPATGTRSIATTASSLRLRPSTLISKQSALLPRPTLLQQSCRRSFADQAPKVELSPTPKPKKRFRFFRLLWRITYLSSAAFVGWIGWSIWQLRNPAEQFEPDPNKKTLVVLGR